MARALSQVYTIIRGSVGGLTYTANQFHQIVVRARTAPVNPHTPHQTGMRSAFSSASEKWKRMSEIQRAAWNLYAPSCIYSGPTGVYTVPGRSIFMAGFSLATYLNLRSLVTNTPVLTQPSQSGFAILGDVIATDPSAPSVVGFDVNVTNPNLENLGIIANISLGFDPSRNFYKGPWDGFKTQGVNVSSEAAGIVQFTGLTEGLKYFFRVKGVIVEGPHRTTTEYFGSYIAVDTTP